MIKYHMVDNYCQMRIFILLHVLCFFDMSQQINDYFSFTKFHIYMYLFIWISNFSKEMTPHP